ncbi:MAG TPA: hypothetical protein DEB23_06170, partial [Chitinophagaceae bacterium]|nr:hypothetical protein [Chitinophagaceae bacterium]
MDYVYNLNGWLKGVNSDTRQKQRDLGKDGYDGDVNTGSYLLSKANIHKNMGEDAFGFSLSYFNGDYEAIGAQGNNFFASVTGNTLLTDTKKQLFNGNIRHMVTSIQSPQDSNEGDLEPQLTSYQYDQLNRIVSMDVFSGASAIQSNSFAGVGISNKYRTRYSYDADGNLQKLQRSGHQAGGSSPDMDDFTYHYQAGKNQLLYVSDAVNNAAYTNDLKNQMPNNYAYDAIGNLIKDEQEEIQEIKWNISGKVSEIIRKPNSTKPDLEFIYDALGQRISKIVKPKNPQGALLGKQHWNITDYVRDASGNTMATYQRKYLASSNLTPGAPPVYRAKLHLTGTNVVQSLVELNVFVDGNPLIPGNMPWIQNIGITRGVFIDQVNQNTSTTGITAEAGECEGCVWLEKQLEP